MSGFYLNELVLGLLARDDPHPRLFDHYARTVHLLAQEHGDLLQAALRTFELLLLQELGLLPLLNVETLTQATVHPDHTYILVPDSGLCRVAGGDPYATGGGQWLAIQQALHSEAAFTQLLVCCAAGIPGLKAQLRHMLQYHCGVAQLHTRQVMQDIQSL